MTNLVLGMTILKKRSVFSACSLLCACVCVCASYVYYIGMYVFVSDCVHIKCVCCVVYMHTQSRYLMSQYIGVFLITVGISIATLASASAKVSNRGG